MSAWWLELITSKQCMKKHMHACIYFRVCAFRCIMKMDHHCPWINSCVGYGNHAYFMWFLLFIQFSCIHIIIIISNFIYRLETYYVSLKIEMRCCLLVLLGKLPIHYKPVVQHFHEQLHTSCSTCIYMCTQCLLFGHMLAKSAILNL